ncbi:MAG: hypothetical protein CMJ64_08330 [Planctomycetaceae bacterium]|nr:hypothetical protein [Planctomycetaceae bacterium]
MIRRAAICCLVVLSTLALCRTTVADVTLVWLKDGRMLAGEIDLRTNDERFWLRSTGTAFVLATSVAWDNVEVANVEGKQVHRAVLKERADELKSKAIEASSVIAPASASESLMHLPRPIITRNAASRVQAIDVEARVSNWDRDAVDDGIEVRLHTRNIYGTAVPVSGQLIVEFVGRKRLPLHDAKAFPQLGRWSLRVDADDFGPHGAVYQLPYRHSGRATNLTLNTHGLVTAKLFVFGHGRFEAETPIYVQRFNPVRDDLTRRRTARDR